MSHDATLFVREVLPHLDPLDRLIMYALASRANWERNGLDECWPSLDRLAADTGLDRSVIVRRMRAIKRAGLVTGYEPVDRRTNVYVINTPGDFWCEDRIKAHGQGPQAVKFGAVSHEFLDKKKARQRAKRAVDQVAVPPVDQVAVPPVDQVAVPPTQVAVPPVSGGRATPDRWHGHPESKRITIEKKLMTPAAAELTRAEIAATEARRAKALARVLPPSQASAFAPEHPLRNRYFARKGRPH